MAPRLLDALAGETAAAADLVIAKGRWACSTACRAAESRTGANADIAARYGWPVVLVVDVSGRRNRPPRSRWAAGSTTRA